MEAISKFVKLNNQNWQCWKFRMEMLLTREDLWYTIDEDRPAAPSVQWKKDDKKARATLGLCIEESQYSLVKNADSACDFWDQLQKYHEKVTITSRVSLLKKLCNLNLLEGGDVESHLFEVEDLFERLVTAGQELEDTLKVAMILRTLPDSYSGLVTALESRPEKDLTVELVKSKLLDEHERRKERSGGVADARALKSGVVEQGARPQERVCWFCEKPGYLRQDCRLWKEKKHGEKGEGKSGKKEKNTEKAKQASEECSSATLFLAGGIRHSGWIIDSGASSHMTNDRSFFASLNTEITPDVVLANGAVVQSAGCGRGIVFGINGSGGLAELTIDEVLYVPSLSNGLLSVSKLASRGLVVVFKESGCDICDSSGTVAARGGRAGSLYHLVVVESVNIGELCHRRFGQKDPEVVDKVNKDNLGIGMKVKQVMSSESALDSEPGEGQSTRATPGKLPERCKDYVVGIAKQSIEEPATYNEAMKCGERDSWKEAMDDEFKSQLKNNTWELVDLPPGKKVVGSRWVYKAKQNEAGEVVRFKARIVAQGYVQRYGIDFDEVFAPVTKYATLRTLLALAGKQKLLLIHLDVKTAYLYGEIEEEIYMRQPPGYEVRGQEEKVCRIRRSIYGLKQSAPRGSQLLPIYQIYMGNAREICLGHLLSHTLFP